MAMVITLDNILLDELENRVSDTYWSDIIKTKTLSDEVTDKYFDRLIPEGLFENQTVSINVIEKHIKDITEYELNLICKNQELTEDFIERHLDIFSEENIETICEFQILHDEFINQYFDLFSNRDLEKILDNQEEISEDLFIRIEKVLQLNGII